METESEKQPLSLDSLASTLHHIQEQLVKAEQERHSLKLQLETIQKQQVQLLDILPQHFSVPVPDVERELNSEPMVEERASIVLEVSLDYSRLEALLASKQWREADLETAQLFLVLGGQEEAGYLSESDLYHLPCKPLAYIDKLWLDASEGRFGFSVQKEIYQALGGKKFLNKQVWQTFGEEVGWYKNDAWLQYDALDFSELAPLGHLPVMGDGKVWFVGGWEGNYRAFSSFVLRLLKC